MQLRWLHSLDPGDDSPAGSMTDAERLQISNGPWEAFRCRRIMYMQFMYVLCGFQITHMFVWPSLFKPNQDPDR